MSSTLFSGLILHRGGKFGRIPVPQLTLDWTVSWHGLLSYWLLRATQDTALSLSLFISWPAFFGPHLYSLLGLLLCYATLPLYIRPLGKLWWVPTHPSITHKPSPESFAGTAQVANAHRPQRVVKVIPASASASTVCIGLSESASRGVCQPQPRLGLHIYRFIWTDGRVIPTLVGILGAAGHHAGSTTKYRVPTAILSSILMSLSSSPAPQYARSPMQMPNAQNHPLLSWEKCFACQPIMKAGFESDFQAVLWGALSSKLTGLWVAYYSLKRRFHDCCFLDFSNSSFLEICVYNRPQILRSAFNLF